MYIIFMHTQDTPYASLIPLLSVSIAARFDVKPARTNKIEGRICLTISDEYSNPAKDLSRGTSFASLRRERRVFQDSLLDGSVHV